MSDLIKRLQKLGDCEHDDVSVAYDAIEEIVRLRLKLERQQWVKVSDLVQTPDDIKGRFHSELFWRGVLAAVKAMPQPPAEEEA